MLFNLFELKSDKSLAEHAHRRGVLLCWAPNFRKAAAAWLAKARATELEIRSITCHQPSHEVNRYTKAASQKVMAKAGMAKLIENKNVPLLNHKSVPPKN